MDKIQQIKQDRFDLCNDVTRLITIFYSLHPEVIITGLDVKINNTTSRNGDTILTSVSADLCLSIR